MLDLVERECVYLSKYMCLSIYWNILNNKQITNERFYEIKLFIYKLIMYKCVSGLMWVIFVCVWVDRSM